MQQPGFKSSSPQLLEGKFADRAIGCVTYKGGTSGTQNLPVPLCVRQKLGAVSESLHTQLQYRDWRRSTVMAVTAFVILITFPTACAVQIPASPRTTGMTCIK